MLLLSGSLTLLDFSPHPPGFHASLLLTFQNFYKFALLNPQSAQKYVCWKVLSFGRKHFETPWTILSLTISQNLLRLKSIESEMSSNYLILCHPLLLLPQTFLASGSFPMSQLFALDSQFLCIRWPKNWSFSFSTSPSNEYSGLISFRIDWFDLLAVQGALESILQYHSSRASILQHSALFMVQLSQLYRLLEKPYLWLYRLLLAKLCLWFLICCLGLS